jgi:hypothetical protein
VIPFEETIGSAFVAGQSFVTIATIQGIDHAALSGKAPTPTCTRALAGPHASRHSRGRRRIVAHEGPRRGMGE